MSTLHASCRIHLITLLSLTMLAVKYATGAKEVKHHACLMTEQELVFLYRRIAHDRPILFPLKKFGNTSFIVVPPEYMTVEFQVLPWLI